MGAHFDANGEIQPNPSGGQEVWHLPANSLRQDYYERYRRQFTFLGRPVVSESYFLRLWQDKFSHVRIPERGRFKGCTE